VCELRPCPTRGQDMGSAAQRSTPYNMCSWLCSCGAMLPCADLVSLCCTQSRRSRRCVACSQQSQLAANARGHHAALPPLPYY
jgi:hypothetical protein